MTKEEKDHYLSVLVELRLFPMTRIIKESDIKNKDTQIEEIVQRFIKELPPYLSDTLDIDKKVHNILVKTEKSHEELEKLQKKHDMEKRLGEER